MSMITEQIKELKDHAIFLNMMGNSYTADLIKKAVSTIEQLAAKVRVEEEIEQKCHTCKHYTKGEYDGSCGSYICKEYSGWEDKTE